MSLRSFLEEMEKKGEVLHRGNEKKLTVSI